MTRTTGDVINDLDNAATGRDAFNEMVQTVLVVGFEHECRMVFHDEPDRLTKLNSMVQGGGTPLGLIKITRTGKAVNFLSRPLIEFRDDPATATLLTEVCTGLGKKVVACEDKGMSSSFAGKGQESPA